jgi:hypothetical protein
MENTKYPSPIMDPLGCESSRCLHRGDAELEARKMSRGSQGHLARVLRHRGCERRRRYTQRDAEPAAEPAAGKWPEAVKVLLPES